MNNKFSSKNMSTVKYFTPTNNLAVNNLTIDDLHEEQREDKLLETLEERKERNKRNCWDW